MAFGPKSILFVPGDRPDRFEKALASRASAIAIDLEDAVALPEKDSARQATEAFLRDLKAPSCDVMVRINDCRSAVGVSDVNTIKRVVAQTGRAIRLILPKADARVLALLSQSFSGEIIALIETAIGLSDAEDLARNPSVVALAFGQYDFAAALGVEVQSPLLDFARMQIRLVSAGAGIAAIDAPFARIDDDSGLNKANANAAAIGYDGMFAIHPRQVGAINRAFTPSDLQLEEAKALLAAAKGHDGGVFVHNGQMVDAPIIKSAERIVNKAGQDK